LKPPDLTSILQLVFGPVKRMIMVRFNSNATLCRHNGGYTGGLTQGNKAITGQAWNYWISCIGANYI